MDRGWFMSARVEMKLKVIGDFRAGKMSRNEAALLLGVSSRSVSRLASEVRRHGPTGICHGNRGKPPCNKSSEDLKERALELYRVKYFDFNMAHCYELLVKEHSLPVSLSTFKAWCREAKIGKRKRRRPSKQRLARERMASRGLLLQMDGSEHEWISGKKWALVGAIDDASSEIPGIGFFNKENTHSCMAVLRQIVEKNGIPVAIYVDQANWFGGMRAEENTQFARVCRELGITLIPALSPEAKGRIERAWRTMQDRLIPEMRLAEVKTMADANTYLNEKFIPNYWHTRLTVTPRDEESRYKVLDRRLNLDEIFCLKFDRHVRRDHTIHFESGLYKLNPSFPGSLAGKTVTIHRYENRDWKVYYQGQEVVCRKHLINRRRWLKAS